MLLIRVFYWDLPYLLSSYALGLSSVFNIRSLLFPLDFWEEFVVSIIERNST